MIKIKNFYYKTKFNALENQTTRDIYLVFVFPFAF